MPRSCLVICQQVAISHNQCDFMFVQMGAVCDRISCWLRQALLMRCLAFICCGQLAIFRDQGGWHGGCVATVMALLWLLCEGWIGQLSGKHLGLAFRLQHCAWVACGCSVRL